ncbi:MAG: cytochrome c family protein [Deltaproteobacteria bacterium]|nr:cytochrome c family protein [Deltaproteobacteria bacterium]MCX7953406.1 cytochrome c family protein [Deltaproteobacteria bacterium]
MVRFGLFLLLWLMCQEKNLQIEFEIPLDKLDRYEDYYVIGKLTGVFNNGKAAPWDFDLIDYFRLFGAYERAKGYKPAQPIKFSHVVHVQKLKMDCTYCHWSVDKSPYAALPSVESCMNCHSQVQSSEKPEWDREIKKLLEFFNKGEQIPWIKVHVQPAYVKFNHEAHVRGGVGCHECHGQVAEMPVVERVSSMKMGWCIECHRQRGASIDCFSCHY